MTTEEKKEYFLQAFEKNACNISASCRSVGISRETFYKWKKNDEEFAKKVKEAEEAIIDFAESAALKKIKDGDTTMLIFFLKTKGKHRGYVEKHEVEGSGGGGNIVINFKEFGEDGEKD